MSKQQFENFDENLSGAALAFDLLAVLAQDSDSAIDLRVAQRFHSAPQALRKTVISELINAGYVVYENNMYSLAPDGRTIIDLYNANHRPLVVESPFRRGTMYSLEDDW